MVVKEWMYFERCLNLFSLCPRELVELAFSFVLKIVSVISYRSYVISNRRERGDFFVKGLSVCLFVRYGTSL